MIFKPSLYGKLWAYVVIKRCGSGARRRIWNTWNRRESMVSGYCQTDAWTICPWNQWLS